MSAVFTFTGFKVEPDKSLMSSFIRVESVRTSPGHLGSVEEDSTRLTVVTAASDTRRAVSVRRFTFDQFEEGIAPESTGNGPLALYLAAHVCFRIRTPQGPKRASPVVLKASLISPFRHRTRQNPTFRGMSDINGIFS